MQQKIQQHVIRDFNRKKFRDDLIQWFYKEQRELPWRKDKDPYKVWVSEIMLQQTRVDTVIPYFNHFMDQFPSIEDLASAEEEKVLKAWEGLGYYSRARNLQSAVKEVVELYASTVPNNSKELSSLKGVGPYTTGAILSIAYGKPEPAVDGNVMRVMSRIFSIWDDIAKPKTRKIFEEVVKETISIEDPSAFNQGLMELGAMVCSPKSPSCLLCPVRDHCRAFEEGVQNELPIKSKKKPPKELVMTALVLRNTKGEILIHKRPSKGLLANLWEFPNHEIISNIDTEQSQLQRYLKKHYSIGVEIKQHLMNIKHIFSHIIWNISVYEGKTTETLHGLQDTKFVKVEELKDYAFPVSHQKIIKEVAQKF